MKYTSWPRPPIHENTNPPPIPSEYMLYGLKYTVIDGNPQLEIPSKPLDKQDIKACVGESMKVFIKTLKTREGSFLNKIRDLHVYINEEINKAKIFETDEMIIIAKNKKTNLKNKILTEIEKIIKK